METVELGPGLPSALRGTARQLRHFWISDSGTGLHMCAADLMDEAAARFEASLPPSAPDRDGLIDFAMQYGPRCRDCGDEDGVCPTSGLPCGDQRKAIGYVVDALLYGSQHGHIAALALPPSGIAEAWQGQMPTIWEDPAGKGYPCFERPMTPTEARDALERYGARIIELESKVSGIDGEAWQGIGTAPKDGRDLLLWTDTRHSDDLAAYIATGGEHFADVQIGFWEDAVDSPLRTAAAGWRTPRIGEPTHWRPLPEPPRALDLSNMGDGE